MIQAIFAFSFGLTVARPTPQNKTVTMKEVKEWFGAGDEFWKEPMVVDDLGALVSFIFNFC